MKLYDLIRQNQALTFIDARTQQEFKLADLDRSLDIKKRKGLIFIYSDNQLHSVEVFLNFLRAEYTISMMSAQLNSEFKIHLEQNYSPLYIYDPQRSEIGGYIKEQVSENIYLFRKKQPVEYNIHPDIKLLLSTSGTTGTPKLVKLSDENMVQNAYSILEYMPVKPEDVIPLNVPIIFVYGLSIFTTNCIAGGKIVCTENDVLKKEFWDEFNLYRFTAISGVPYMYEMLYRIGFFKKDHPSLRYMTHTGGILNDALVKIIAEYVLKYNKRFFAQYGQTEASGRMAFLPPEDLSKKGSSIGFPVKNGRFEINEDTSELIYYGPNVFGGYAKGWQDLSSFHHTDKLHTGDIARKDEEGYYYITGRIKRIIKLFGTRYNLDDIELILKNNLGGKTFICTGVEDKYLSVLHLDDCLENDLIHQVLRDKLNLHPASVRVKCVTSVPLTPNGKIDYKQVILLQEA